MKKSLIIFFVMLSLKNLVFSEDYYSWDFAACELKDIIFAVSVDTGFSITSDDTVMGHGSFRYVGKEFKSAFDSFALENRLYVNKGDSAWTVSKYNFTQSEEGLSFDVFDLSPLQIVEKLSLEINEVITFDSLPSSQLSLHFRNLSKDELLQSLARRFGSYEVRKEGRGYHIARKNEIKNLAAEDCRVKIIKNEDASFQVDIKNSGFIAALEEVMKVEEEKEYCISLASDSRIVRTSFRARDFSDLLEKLCGQSGVEYLLQNNIYYFVSASGPREDFIYGKREWKKYCLKYSKVNNLLNILTKTFPQADFIVMAEVNGFLCKAEEKLQSQIEVFLKENDLEKKTYEISLKYAKAESLIKNLSALFEKAQISLSENNRSLYFTGTAEEYEKFTVQVELMDKADICLSYDLLILQYDESLQNNWYSSFSTNRLSLGDRNSLGAQLGSVMNFNLNVISAFGLSFAANVQSSIEENSTKVYADTVLHGISGSPISFQNTSTYRYRDNNLDPETGKPVYSGVTREITSGIKLDICGWVNGEGLITSNVTASLSRQGSDTSALTGNPPPTTEKIVTTQVRGKSGQAIVLSGLTQSSASQERSRSPFLSKLPFVGKLFRKDKVIEEKSQMVIFLVPHTGGEIKKEEKLFDQKWAEKRIAALRELEVLYE